jgi:hypothetical protein
MRPLFRLINKCVPFFQGYLISPPRSVAALAEWVAIRNHTPADLNLEPQKLALR